MTQKLQLPMVTLCCVDTRSPQQAIYALHQSMKHADFGQVILLSEENAKSLLEPATGITLVPIPPLHDIDDYSKFMLKELGKHINTAFALVVQWDGFVTNPAMWRESNLEWDYIGAPWYHDNHPGYVGNGGFSLRSRKLLQATPHLNPKKHEPEDMSICVSHFYELHVEHGIQIAPLEVAQTFSYEYGQYRPSFGFHGMHNFTRLMDSASLRTWIIDAPIELLKSKQTRKLAKSLIQAYRIDDALLLIKLRQKHLGRTLDHYSLCIRANFRKFKKLVRAKSSKRSHHAQ